MDTSREARADLEIDHPRRHTEPYLHASRPTAMQWLAAVLSLGAIAYGVWQVWTALALSAGAASLWRWYLILLEGGVPALLALGFGVAAMGGPRTRRWGWGMAAATIVVFVLWVRHLVATPDMSGLGAP